MRIAELSRRSATSIPSIKYYLREGLIPGGRTTGRNQADYDEAHVRRLRLIRALVDVGGLSIAAVRDVLAAVDNPDLPGHDLLGIAHHAVSPTPARRDPDDPRWQAAREEVVTLIGERGWLVSPCSPALDVAADAIAAMRALDQADLLSSLPTYVEAVERMAAWEVAAVLARGEPARMVEGLVTGTILGEILIGALRRLAQEAESARLQGLTAPE
ncbi:MerR family transcriptional regulator [Luedemannella flava]|uniref:MerR family transcriptional regulator n=1 Tax=Luedemannella flava TaxID=349316 RepID=A0ABN2LT27_9ACTN